MTDGGPLNGSRSSSNLAGQIRNPKNRSEIVAVRVGLIGAGIMGADHARIIAAQIPGAVLQVVCDADAARAKGVADETGAADVSGDPHAVIQSPSVDAVLIASPDTTHGSLTIAAIAARKPVLCEKPLAPTTDECRQVIGAEVKAGRRLAQIGFMRRFDPSYVEMKAHLAKGVIGKALMFHCFHRNVSAPASFTGRMAITNSAPHEFDIARWMLDTDYASISVFQPQNVDAAKTGAPVFMVVKTAAGQLVNIEVNINAAYGYDVRGELVGEKGSVSLRAPVACEVSVNLSSGLAYPEDWRPRFAEAYRLQNLAWIRSIGTGKPVGASAWDGYCATLTAEAGVAALERGAEARVTPISKPKLYEGRA
jgi:myo-inositol 2-dehydrogenase / D-chiro-inositol 1-dehydrogenase